MYHLLTACQGDRCPGRQLVEGKSIRQYHRHLEPFQLSRFGLHGCSCVHKSFMSGLLDLSVCQQLARVGGRDGISSRAEMQHGFPTAEVRHKDTHVANVSSLTRSCKVRKLATLSTR